jgi:hypothetical protein
LAVAIVTGESDFDYREYRRIDLGHDGGFVHFYRQLGHAVDGFADLAHDFVLVPFVHVDHDIDDRNIFHRIRRESVDAGNLLDFFFDRICDVEFHVLGRSPGIPGGDDDFSEVSAREHIPLYVPERSQSEHYDQGGQDQGERVPFRKKSENLFHGDVFSGVGSNWSASASSCSIKL